MVGDEASQSGSSCQSWAKAALKNESRVSGP